MEIWDAYDENFNIIEGITLVRGEEANIPRGRLMTGVFIRKWKNMRFITTVCPRNISKR